MPTNIDYTLRVKQTKLLFFTLCLYLLSQGYLIPVFAIGPSWVVWPRITDFIIVLFVLLSIFKFKYLNKASKYNQSLFNILVIIFFGCILSFVLYLNFHSANINKGFYVGAHNIYRFFQALCVFFVAMRLPLTKGRINILRRLVTVTLLFVCFGVILTYLSIIPLRSLISHLPASSEMLGTWMRYANFTEVGFGTISYNHAYTALQVIMLIGLTVSLSSDKGKLMNVLLFILSIFVCFLTESRAGLVAIVFFAVVFWVKKPVYAFFAVVVIAVVLFSGIIPEGKFSSFAPTLERHKTILEIQDTENFSGRYEIWQDRLAFINQEPTRWIWGEGFGSALDSGDQAHMIFLQIIFETGVIGLLLFLLFFYRLLSYLRMSGAMGMSIFWVTVALLISSLTQETFYPNIAFPYFIGLFLCSVSIVLNDNRG